MNLVSIVVVVSLKVQYQGFEHITKATEKYLGIVDIKRRSMLTRFMFIYS